MYLEDKQINLNFTSEILLNRMNLNFQKKFKALNLQKANLNFKIEDFKALKTRGF
ncbi:MAG: hypothetical protein ABIA76_02375 [Candidatus Diapherotrites archaeon]